jgi:hypothetical protein
MEYWPSTSTGSLARAAASAISVSWRVALPAWIASSAPSISSNATGSAGSSRNSATSFLTTLTVGAKVQNTRTGWPSPSARSMAASSGRSTGTSKARPAALIASENAEQVNSNALAPLAT